MSDNIFVLSNTPDSCSRISTVGYDDKYVEAAASRLYRMYKIGGDNDDDDNVGENIGGQRKLETLLILSHQPFMESCRPSSCHQFLPP